MGINLDKIMGFNQRALTVFNRRSEVLAANLANADTPNYKARDIDFQAVLKGAVEGERSLPLKVTQPGHIRAGGEEGFGELLYRIPHQPAVDGNTVETAEEQARFSENAMRYLVEVRFTSDKIRGIKRAIKGE